MRRITPEQRERFEQLVMSGMLVREAARLAGVPVMMARHFVESMHASSAGAHVHVIPVDPSLTPDEAWLEQCIFGKRVTFTGSEQWAVVTGCDGEQCRLIEREDDV